MDLAGNGISKENIQIAHFQAYVKIISNDNDILQQQLSFPITTGDMPISSPLDLADVLEFDTSFLNWSKQPDRGLQGIEFSLFEDDWVASRTIFINKESINPANLESCKWLVKKPQANSKLSAQVFFLVAEKNGIKRIPWKHNEKDLRREIPGLSQIFFDQDWLGE